MATEFDYYKLRVSERYGGGVDVLGFGTYPDNSVLAGQTMKQFINTYPDEAAAKAAYPQAEGFCGYESVNTFSHLPGPDDNVRGGSLPDDYND